jgi:hypothetical protein
MTLQKHETRTPKTLALLASLAAGAAGLWTPSAHAVPIDDLICESNSLQLPVYFDVGARKCANGTTENDSGTCFYQVPCLIMNPERRAALVRNFHAPWKDLTDEQRTMFINSMAGQWLPTELSCKVVTEAGVAPGTCPAPNNCKRDAYVSMHPATPDTRAGIPATFTIERETPAAGGAR